MCKSCGFIGGLFVGAIIGSAVGFLCAPESGEQTRQKIKDSTQDYLDDVKSSLDAYGGDAKKYIDDVSNSISNRIKDYKDQLESKIQEIQNEVNADIAELNEELELLHNEEENQHQNIETIASEVDE